MDQLIDDDAVKARVLQTTERLEGMVNVLEESHRDAEMDRLTRENAAMKATLENTRRPSKAHLIGAPRPDSYPTGYDPERGRFLKAVMDAGSRLAHEQEQGIGTLRSMGRFYQTSGKATLGSTDATGGFIAPNATVDSIIKPGLFENPYWGLMDIITGVNSPSVDVPWRGAAPARALVVARGQTKTNLDLAYGGYTATMYTLAQIYDVAKQFVRQSAGAAEQDVMSELAHGFALGSAYYLRDGSGTSEPYGFVTAIGTAPFSPVITTSHTAAAATVAGNVATAIAKAAGALLARSRRPTAAVMSASGYTELLSTGSDTAGFFFAGLGEGVGSPFAPGTLVSPFGIPVVVDPAMATDDLYVADWKAFKVYVGEDFRVDTSEEAGERWDKNLVGFRGEMDLAFDARPAVYAGALQVVADILA